MSVRGVLQWGCSIALEFPISHVLRKAFHRLAELRVHLSIPQTTEHNSPCSTSVSPCSSSIAWIWHKSGSPSPTGSGSITPHTVTFRSCFPWWQWPWVIDKANDRANLTLLWEPWAECVWWSVSTGSDTLIGSHPRQTLVYNRSRSIRWHWDRDTVKVA